MIRGRANRGRVVAVATVINGERVVRPVLGPEEKDAEQVAAPSRASRVPDNPCHFLAGGPPGVPPRYTRFVYGDWPGCSNRATEQITNHVWVCHRHYTLLLNHFLNEIKRSKGEELSPAWLLTEAMKERQQRSVGER